MGNSQRHLNYIGIMQRPQSNNSFMACLRSFKQSMIEHHNITLDTLRCGAVAIALICILCATTFESGIIRNIDLFLFTILSIFTVGTFREKTKDFDIRAFLGLIIIVTITVLCMIIKLFIYLEIDRYYTMAACFVICFSWIYYVRKPDQRTMISLTVLYIVTLCIIYYRKHHWGNMFLTKSCNCFVVAITFLLTYFHVNYYNQKLYDCKTNAISIPIFYKYNNDKYSKLSTKHVETLYVETTTMHHILQEAIHIIDKVHPDKSYSISTITKESFIKIHFAIQLFEKDWDTLCSIAITKYSWRDIIAYGLTFTIEPKHTHTITNSNLFLCEYITDGAHDPLHCPIYKAIKVEKKYTEDYLHHIYNHDHFIDEQRDKECCSHGYQCKSFIAVQNDGKKLKDRCHMKLYRHPPRSSREMNMSQDINCLIINTSAVQNKDTYTIEEGDGFWATVFLKIFTLGFYTPTTSDKEQYNFNEKDGFLQALVKEIIDNGYKYDLCHECNLCKKNSICSHLKMIVDEKLKHHRHTRIGSPLHRDHMLALILYTGGQCNYDLCKSQRNKDYKKWKWFDYCLYEAIEKLSEKETGKYTLFSGLNCVKLNKKEILNGYFPTYTSTSWNKEVAKQFITTNKGMLIQFDGEFRSDDNNICCDVSWISRFEDECEILIGRSKGEKNNFILSVCDEHDDIQAVHLKSKKNKID